MRLALRTTPLLQTIFGSIVPLGNMIHYSYSGNVGKDGKTKGF